MWGGTKVHKDSFFFTGSTLRISSGVVSRPWVSRRTCQIPTSFICLFWAGTSFFLALLTVRSQSCDPPSPFPMLTGLLNLGLEKPTDLSVVTPGYFRVRLWKFNFHQSLIVTGVHGPSFDIFRSTFRGSHFLRGAKVFTILHFFLRRILTPLFYF